MLNFLSRLCGGRRFTLIKYVDEQVLLAVIKQIDDGEELFLQSYRISNNKEVEKLIQTGDFKVATRQGSKSLAHALGHLTTAGCGIEIITAFLVAAWNKHIMIKIEINNKSDVLGAVDAILRGIEQRVPLMRRLSGTLYSAVMQNFDAGGRPAWAGLKYRSGKPLNNTGSLRGSISEEYDSNHAVVGTNDVRAKIHQFSCTGQASQDTFI